MKLQENLKAFVDGELSIAERHLVGRHLETSEADRKAVDDLNRLSVSIRVYVTQPEPVGLEATLTALETAKPKSKAQALISHQLRWIGGFAAAIIAVGVIGSVLFPVFAQSKDSAKKSSAISEAKMAAVRAEVEADSSAAASRTADRGGVGQMFAKHATSGGGGSVKSIQGLDGITGSRDAGGAPTVSKAMAPPTPTPAPSWLHRTMVVKNASLTVKVKNVAESQHTVEAMAVGFGGYVEQSNRTEAEGEKGQAALTIRVPVQRYEDALRGIRGLGDVIGETNNGRDVTADVVDMDARLRVLRTEEADYVALLARARTTAGIIEIRDKLTEIRQEIEGIVSQRASTKDLATYSTINVQLTQPEVKPKEEPKPEDQGWLNGTWSTAVDGLSAAGKIIAQLFIFVLVWSPIWIPVALLSAWLYRRTKW